MNLPAEFTDRMKLMLGNEYDDFINTFDDETPYAGLRLNLKKENTEKLFSEFISKKDKIPWCSYGYYTDKQKINGNHPYHIAGMCYFQEPSAMASVEALNIKEDDFVLDLCAAPGGKSTQAGAKLSENGLLVANEIIPKRAAILAENTERFGFMNTIITNENPEKLVDKFAGFFDKIIVDAPCSGEGMFKKEPKAITEWSINHTKTCAVRQKHIMDCAYKMLREGGNIAYSTCTFAPCENEGVIEYMLCEYPDLSLVDTGLDMLSGGNGAWTGSDMDMSKTKHIFPHINKGEGHFLAVLHKQGKSGDRIIPHLKTKENIKTAVKLFKDFEKAVLNTNLDGAFDMFKDNLYLIPHGIQTDKIKLLRAGFYLGTIKKNRFEPSHALALALKYNDFKNKISFSASDEQLKKYLRGETLESEINGYTAVMVDKNPLGWAKGSCGILKNHFPKHLRIQ